MPQSPPSSDPSPDTDALIAELLARVRVIALVGASARPERPSHRVMQFLQARGYRVIPVNPGLAGQTLLGETVRAALPDIAETIDMVDIFRAPDQVGPVVDAAIAAGARWPGVAIWMQLGVVDEAAATRARAAGLAVVMDRCPAIEIPRLRIAPPMRS
jgi:predicted CoA-binding protein